MRSRGSAEERDVFVHSKRRVTLHVANFDIVSPRVEVPFGEF
jgi:hypothetical protein